VLIVILGLRVSRRQTDELPSRVAQSLAFIRDSAALLQAHSPPPLNDQGVAPSPRAARGEGEGKTSAATPCRVGAGRSPCANFPSVLAGPLPEG
jgi:hypothetical protein